MEGAEPIGTDLNLLYIFYELGLRVIGLTHARSNAAGSGGVFAPTGSSPKGLTAFGCELVRECERVGVILDLAHINPAGFDDILENTTRPVIVSHTNARKYYDIERNISDEQIKMVGARGGVIGINSVLVSPKKEDSTLDRYVDHVAYVIDLIGIDGVGIGFDFFEFIYRRWSEDERVKFHQKFPNVHFIPDLLHHGHARNLTAKLIERGFNDGQIEKILFRNWMRIFEELL
jgi:membrane dipeptidase